MIWERIYRTLLALYPREHRREYGELMVQLFRDRMRHEGGGFRRLVVWTQMMRDLFVSAYEEHKRGGDMKKRMWIAVGSVVALMIVVVGVGVVLLQSSDEIKLENDEVNIKVLVWDGSSTLSAEGINGVVDVLERELDEDVTVQESEFGIDLSLNEIGWIMSFGFWELPATHFVASWELPDTHHLYSVDEEFDIAVTVWLDSDPLPIEEFLEATEYLAEDLRQWVKDGEMDQEEADRALSRMRWWDTIMLEEWD